MLELNKRITVDNSLILHEDVCLGNKNALEHSHKRKSHLHSSDTFICHKTQFNHLHLDGLPFNNVCEHNCIPSGVRSDHLTDTVSSCAP